MVVGGPTRLEGRTVPARAAVIVTTIVPLFSSSRILQPDVLWQWINVYEGRGGMDVFVVSEEFDLRQHTVAISLINKLNAIGGELGMRVELNYSLDVPGEHEPIHDLLRLGHVRSPCVLGIHLWDANQFAWCRYHQRELAGIPDLFEKELAVDSRAKRFVELSQRDYNLRGVLYGGIESYYRKDARYDRIILIDSLGADFYRLQTDGWYQLERSDN